MFFGEGGALPMLGMLSRRFPESRIVATGVLGPGSNAHGPNEALHLSYANSLTAALALTMAMA